jgi:hypothetical protein
MPYKLLAQPIQSSNAIRPKTPPHQSGRAHMQMRRQRQLGSKQSAAANTRKIKSKSQRSKDPQATQKDTRKLQEKLLPTVRRCFIVHITRGRRMDNKRGRPLTRRSKPTFRNWMRSEAGSSCLHRKRALEVQVGILHVPVSEPMGHQAQLVTQRGANRECDLGRHKSRPPNRKCALDVQVSMSDLSISQRHVGQSKGVSWSNGGILNGGVRCMSRENHP